MRTPRQKLKGWTYNTGYINDDMMRDHLYSPSDDTLCLLCGPPPMVNYTCIPGLDRLGHKSWTYSVGFINDMMIKVNLFPADDSTITLMCGPPPMINFACNPALDQLGYHPDNRFAY
ncbi:NADH-cytochrome b5 reductase 3 [Lucilia cuprina]|nr:NADH-cytochrome b5 reductase 3 [Lucilia cuprina]